MTTKNFVVKNGLTTGNIILDAGSSNVSANFVVANLSVPSYANLGSVSNINIGGGVSGQVLSTDGAGVLSWITPTGGGGSGTPGGSNTYVQFNDAGSFGGNSSFTFNKTTGTLSATIFSGAGNLLSNIQGANVSGPVAYATTANSVSGSNVSGPVAYATTANSVAGANVSGEVAFAAVANSVAGANVSGYVPNANVANTAYSVSGSNVVGAVNEALIAGTVTINAQPNITSVGTLNSLTVSGNLTVNGTFEYANVTTFNVKDPIIEQGGNPNGTALSSNDGYDRGQLLHYYSGTAKDAFMGWDNSNAEFAFGSDVSVSGEVVTFNTFGNVRANNFIGTLVGAATSATTAATVTTNAQPNITSVGTLNGLTASSTVNFTSSSNVSLGPVGNIHITGGTAGYVLQTDGSGTLTWWDPTPTTTTYVPNSLALTNGVYVSGGLSDIQTFGDYGSGNVYTLTDGTGSAPAWIFTVDFTNVVSFNRVVMNINYTQSSGHTIYVQLYNTSTSLWDSIGTYTGLGSYYAFALEVIDEAAYINGSNIVQLRLYHSNAGNSGHQTSIDYIALEQSTQGPQGPRGPTGATGAAGNGVATGGTSGQVLIKNSSTNYDTAWSSDLVSLGNVTLTGNISSGNANLGNLVTANYHSGNGSLLSSITGSNVTGTVANATYATTAGSATTAATVTTAAQPNITSLGTLASLSVTGLTTATGGVKTANILDVSSTVTIQTKYSGVSGAVGILGNLIVGTGGSGNITATNANLGNAVTANYFIGDGGLLTNVAGGGSSLTITNDTSTDATYYPVYATSSSGTMTTAGITTTKLQFNPSSGQLTVQDLNTLSDATLKTNATPIEDPMSILSQIFGMGFNWADSGKKSYGMMAQMLETVLPELVSVNAQGKKTVNYIPIIAFLVEAVKKQQSDIEALKKR